MDPRIAQVEKEYMRSDLPSFAPGDTVRVRVRVREGDKERVQPFEGICIARGGAGLGATFTLRRISGGVGVERIFPLHSPWIAGLEVVRRGDVRRAKLYYLRNRRGKSARVRERKWWLDKNALAEAGIPSSDVESVDATEAAAEMAAEDGAAVDGSGEVETTAEDGAGKVPEPAEAATE